MGIGSTPAVARWCDSGDPDLPLLAVENRATTAVFLPGVGGRLLSLQVADEDILWFNPQYFTPELRVVRPRTSWPEPVGTFTSWANVGGDKTWPAPQGWDGPDQWAGPPDRVLDAGPYATSVRSTPDHLLVELTSQDDPTTGLRVTRQFRFGPQEHRIDQRIVFRNISAHTRRWAIWEVVQVNTADSEGRGTVEVPLTSPDPVVDLGQYRGPVDVDVTPTSAYLRVQPGVAKFGFPGAAGSVRWTCPGRPGLMLRTAVDPTRDYPDQGSRIELWTQSPVTEPILDGWRPDDWLIELEVLGPLRVLPSGEESALHIEWTLDGRNA
jgi:hypothetical protein